jgi:hypothetical protein
MQRVASVLREPALGGRIIDSDNAALYGSDANGKLAFEFPINDWNLDDLDAVESRLRESWLVPDQRRAAAERLASWSSSYAPQAVTPELLLAGMPGHGSTEAPTDDIYFGQMPSAWTLDSEDEWDGGYAPGGEWYRGGGAWLFAEDGIRFLFARLGLDSICNDVWNAA